MQYNHQLVLWVNTDINDYMIVYLAVLVYSGSHRLPKLELQSTVANQKRRLPQHIRRIS